jgi:hypothetical protein
MTPFEQHVRNSVRSSLPLFAAPDAWRSALRAASKPPGQGDIAAASTVVPCCPYAQEARGPREALPVDLLRSTNVSQLDERITAVRNEFTAIIEQDDAWYMGSRRNWRHLLHGMTAITPGAPCRKGWAVRCSECLNVRMHKNNFAQVLISPGELRHLHTGTVTGS